MAEAGNHMTYDCTHDTGGSFPSSPELSDSSSSLSELELDEDTSSPSLRACNLKLNTKHLNEQEGIPVGCSPSACQPYVLQWPPPDRCQ